MGTMTDREEKIFQKLHALALASKRAFEHFHKGRDEQVWSCLEMVEKELFEAKNLIKPEKIQEQDIWHDF